MTTTEREQLVDEIVERLRTEGAPQGSWLVDIAGARYSLRGVDDLLRRLELAITSQFERAERDDA